MKSPRGKGLMRDTLWDYVDAKNKLIEKSVEDKELEFEEAVEKIVMKAYKENRIPIECFEEIDIGPMHVQKVLKWIKDFDNE